MICSAERHKLALSAPYFMSLVVVVFLSALFEVNGSVFLCLILISLMMLMECDLNVNVLDSFSYMI